MRRKTLSLVLVFTALVMAWGVFSHSFLTYWAQSNAGEVIRIRPTHPTALLKLAHASLSETVSSDQAALIARFEGMAKLPIPQKAQDEGPSMQQGAAPDLEVLARSILRSNPINAQAFSMLGSARAQAGDSEAADLFMQAAANRSPRVQTATYWMMRKSFEDKDYAKTVLWADGLLRVLPSNIQFAAPFLWRIAEDRQASHLIKDQLLSPTPWRSALFRSVKGNISDARTPLQLYLQLKTEGKAPADRELSSYMLLLIENKLYDVAYNTWLQTLSAEQLAHAGYLYDGGFEFEPGPFLFNWSFARSPGVSISRTPKEDSGGMMVVLDFSGARTPPQLLSQTTMLRPGAYTLAGTYRGQVRSRRGLVWTLECLGGGPRLGETEPILGAEKKWSSFELNVEVPTKDCQAQILKFVISARSDSETMLSGSLALSMLEIRKNQKHN